MASRIKLVIFLHEDSKTFCSRAIRRDRNKQASETQYQDSYSRLERQRQLSSGRIS